MTIKNFFFSNAFFCLPKSTQVTSSCVLLMKNHIILKTTCYIVELQYKTGRKEKHHLALVDNLP